MPVVLDPAAFLKTRVRERASLTVHPGRASSSRVWHMDETEIPRLGECGIAMQQGSQAKARPSDLNLAGCASAYSLEELPCMSQVIKS